MGLDWPQWDRIFVPDQSLLESFLRGTFVYFGALVLMRVIPRRQVGSVGLTDILLLVLLSECVSQALTDDSVSIPNGVVAMAAMMFWNYALDWAGHRSKWVRHLLEPDPVELIRDGRPIRENLDKQKITDEELTEQLRRKGVGEVGAVRSAYMESGGQVSVVPIDAPTGHDPSRNGPPAPAAAPAPSPDGPPDFEALLAAFQAAARNLQVGVAWHEERAAEHAGRAKEARQVLARYGVRIPRRTAGSERDVHARNGRPPVSVEAGDSEHPQE
jgi:uncharacterized membrane protein YcaP (DUF421 family)